MLNGDLSSLRLGMASLKVSSDDLPITQYKSRIIEEVRRSQIVVIYGETGSGKTTQIPQYLFEARINNDLIIGITQPRRIAAVSMATRVAQEMNCNLGIEVGYEVRFDNKSSASTKVKYMTDGTLLNHCLNNPTLSEYGVIMIDEAHERSVHSDVLLGLLKVISSKRKDLKILITSATMKTETFSAYFNRAPIFSFEGRLFPVEVVYEPSYNYQLSAVQIVLRIHGGTEPGDILVFLTGQEEIESCCESLSGIPDLVVMPLIGSMDSDTQHKVFDRVERGKRKVVVSTNIAETTITIEGIKFVIDCGYVKQNTFVPRLGMELLQETRISKAQADQRKGRAGRTMAGKCFRLYSEATYNGMLEETISEIKRKNLCEVYLKLVAIGLDPMTFAFIDRPDNESLKRSERELQDLGMLDGAKQLTDIGLSMSDLPVEPILGKVLIASKTFSCTFDIVTIMSMMTERNVFIRPKKQSHLSDMRHKEFKDNDGDHFTRLKVFNEFIRNGSSKYWCQRNYLKYDTLIRVEQARDQLANILRRKNMFADAFGSSDKTSMKKSIIKGYYKNICVKRSRGTYVKYSTNEILYIHPGSCLFQESPELILYHEVLQTKKAYMHGILKLDHSLLGSFPEEMVKINYNPRRVSASGLFGSYGRDSFF